MSHDHEINTIRAVVRALDGADALVEVEQGGCGRCHEKGGCGGQHLTQMFCSGPRSWRVANDVHANIGDRVTLAIAEGSIRRSANLAYGSPLVGAIAGAMAGSVLAGDHGAMLGAGLGLAMSFFFVRSSARRLEKRAARPHIVSRS